MCPILIFDSDLIECEFSIRLSLTGIVAKRWTSLGKLVKFVGQPAVDVVYGMEKRSLEPTLGVFKECEGLMPDRLSGIVIYMSGNKSTILGIKREIKGEWAMGTERFKERTGKRPIAIPPAPNRFLQGAQKPPAHPLATSRHLPPRPPHSGPIHSRKGAGILVPI